MEMKKLGFLILSIIFSLQIHSVLAQDILSSYGDAVTQFASTTLGIPSEWLRLPLLIYNVVIPFLGIMAVSLGMLKQLRIFPRAPQIEILLAFLMAFSTLPSKAFVTFVTLTLGVMGGWAYLVFIFLFFVGSAFFSVIRIHGWKAEMSAEKALLGAAEDLNKRLEQIAQQREALEIAYANKQIDPDKFNKRMEELDKQYADLTTRIRNLRRWI